MNQYVTVQPLAELLRLDERNVYMYLISAYFDEQTNKRINGYIEKIAEQTGNTFMIENQVPPHMTISAVEARNGELLIPYVDKLQNTLYQGNLQFVSVGMFFPYVMYLAPVLNGYLQEMAEQVYQSVCNVPEVSVNRCYKPMQWMPHITLGKKLTKEQLRIAFAIMQERFAPFEGNVTGIGLAKTNPHEDILRMSLGCRCAD